MIWIEGMKSLCFYLLQVVVQQLPEWKAHEWNYEKEDPSSESL